MRSIDGFGWNDIASTPGAFDLQGGDYGITLAATGTGTVTLERLGDDGVTYVPVNMPGTVATPAALAANGMIVVKVPRGIYKLVIASFTANYLSIIRIPGE
jgi:hypothetical protein